MQNLSHLADGSLTMDSSMQGGNTVSVNPPFGAPGSPSEAYESIPEHDRPEPDLGPNNDSQLKTTKNDSGSFRRPSTAWKMVN